MDAPKSPAVPTLLEPYCIFCRNGTAYYDYRVADNPEPWEEEVLGFCELPGSENIKKRRGYLFRLKTHIDGVEHIDVDENVDRELMLARIQLTYDQEDDRCGLENTANVVHIPCLQLARAKIPQLSIAFLCQVARALRPIVAWRHARHLIEERGSLSALPQCSGSDTKLSALLRKIAMRLPIEVQALVSHHVTHGLFSSLAKTLETVTWLGTSSHILSTAVRPFFSVQPLSYHTKTIKIGAKIVNILGESCLVAIKADSLGYEDEILVSGQQPKGLQCGLGLYGVVGLRIHYADGSASAWLGQESPKWVQFLPGSDLSRLVACSDGIKLLSLNFDTESQTSPTESQSRNIWNYDMGFVEPNTCSLIDLPRYSEAKIRGNPQTRYAEYLPLRFDDGSIHSLTAFCSIRGVCCIQIDSDPSRRLGRPSEPSCPITFYLEANEMIQSLYIGKRGPIDVPFYQGPYLLATTTTGRSLYYGPFIMPSLPLARLYFTECSINPSIRVSGIFSDPLNAQPYILKTLGVVAKTQGPSGSISPPPFVPVQIRYVRNSLIASYPKVTFVTKASFAHCESLKLQKFGQRCVGLLASIGGTLHTLGQWDPTNEQSISTLYSKQHNPIGSIVFIYSEGPENERYVEDITVNGDLPMLKPYFQWDELSKQIAWHFTFQYDQLEVWDDIVSEANITDSDVPVIPVPS